MYHPDYAYAHEAGYDCLRPATAALLSTDQPDMWSAKAPAASIAVLCDHHAAREPVAELLEASRTAARMDRPWNRIWQALLDAHPDPVPLADLPELLAEIDPDFADLESLWEEPYPIPVCGHPGCSAYAVGRAIICGTEVVGCREHSPLMIRDVSQRKAPRHET